MARKTDDKKDVKVKKPQAQKVIVTQGRHPLFGMEMKLKTLFEKKVSSFEEAKELEKILIEEYKGQEGISVYHFGI